MWSLEGAYQEDLEDSARCLSMVSSSGKNNTERTLNSNVQPDNVTSIGSDDENISVDKFSSISSLSISSASGDDDSNSVSSSDDIDGRISFLQKKQALLERAMKALQSEEMYTASIAHSVIDKSHPCTTISSLCEEARTMLKALKRDDKDNDGDSTSSSSSKHPTKRKEQGEEDESKNEGPSKRLKIDITTVSRRVSTKDAVFPSPVAAAVPVSEDEEDDCEAEPYPVKGKWMAKSFLRYHKPSFEASQYDNWKIKRDPYVGNVAVPPSPTPFDRETELKDALSFTSTPQLITSAVPPFNVVHANAAFAILSGMNNTVGSSVENIFQVDTNKVLETSSSSNATHQIFPDQILLNGKACQIVLTPIVDRVQNPKGGVSHLLLQVQQGDHAIAVDDIPLSSIAGTQGTGRNNNRVFLTTIG